MVHLFSKMLLSRVHFSSWLTSLWSLNMFFLKVIWHYVTLCLQAVILRSFRCWNTDWPITWDRIWISVSCTLSSYIPLDVHSCLFCTVTGIKAEEMISSHALCGATSLELRHYSDLSLHIKQHQNGIYCLNIVIIWTEFEIWDLVLYQNKSNKAQSLLRFIGWEGR